MSKHMAALTAALVMTACAAVAVFAIGGAALLNPSGVAPSNSVGQGAKVANASLVQQQSSDQAQVQQLQAEIAQYQAQIQQYQSREQQYQQALTQAQTSAQQAQAQAGQQTQEVRQLLLALQQQGLITINPDGSIIINR